MEEYRRWIYHPNGDAKIIASHVIPEGWFRTPSEVKAFLAQPKKEEAAPEVVEEAAPEVEPQAPKRRGRKPSR